MTAQGENTVFADNRPHDVLAKVEALCRLSERCQAVAKFSEFREWWYGKSEQYAKDACGVMDQIQKKS